MEGPVELVVDADQRRLPEWQEHWHVKELLYFFTRKDIRITYTQMLPGSWWAILHPLPTVVIFTLLLGRVLKIPSEYLPFNGLLLWNAYETNLANSARLLCTAQIIKSTNSCLSSGPHNS